MPSLLTLPDVPAWLDPNPYIQTGYRVYYPWPQTFASLFGHHNETGNIWTHFLGGLFFIAVIFVLWFRYSLLDESFWDVTVLACLLCAALACFFGSTWFHLTRCHSPSVYDTGSTLDFCGIGYMITGSFVPPIYFLFHCTSHLRTTYLVQIGLSGTVMGILPWFRVFHSEEWFHKRLAVYLISVGSAVVPLGHAFLQFPLNETTIPLYVGLGLMLLFYGIGVCVYVSLAPERWFPGKFDFWLHSHQLWHCFVFSAAVVHFFTCFALYRQYKHDICLPH